ncbi:MAG: formylglycine-generating enzyme family protein [Candidatus Poribacteria bacterium]|nr:formylglycine-generating enzyme family protein [Candidatus Poribacteria bacterium]
MKTFYIIACLLILALSQQVVSAQQPPATEPTEESAEGFIKLEMPLEEALTKTTFVVRWLSGEGSTEVIFQGENVIRTADYIELRIPYENDSSRYSSYKILTKYAVETHRYIFVPLDDWGGGSGIFRSLHAVDKKTLRTVEKIALGDRSGIWGLTAADPATNTIAMTYIREEDWRGNLTDSLDKAITGHLRMIEGKLRDVAGPLSPIPPDMVFFRAGRFFGIGSDKWEKDAEPDEKPQHNVHLDAFYMDKYETTNAQYKEFIDANPQWQKNRIPKKYHDGDYLKHWNGNDYPPDKGNHPVVYVSWYAAMAYAEWRGKRLPTEAEWERAARSSWHWRAINADTANYGENVGDTTPVGMYPLDASGLYDMAGNVWEWCLDEYNPDFYAISPSQNPLAGGTMENILSDWRNVKTVRVLRGGSWVSNAKFVQVSDRTRFTPKITNKARGFRCVKPVTP